MHLSFRHNHCSLIPGNQLCSVQTSVSHFCTTNASASMSAAWILHPGDNCQQYLQDIYNISPGDVHLKYHHVQVEEWVFPALFC